MMPPLTLCECSCLYLYPVEQSWSHLPLPLLKFVDTVSMWCTMYTVVQGVCGWVCVWERECVGPCAGGSHQHHHHAMKQSFPATIRPFHAKAKAKWSFHAQTVRAIDLSYVIWNDLCVIISLVLSDPDSMKWVSLCVLGDDLPLFISDLSYTTQVIQYVSQWEGYTLECVLCLCDCVNFLLCRFIFSFFFFFKIFFRLPV